MRVRHFVPRLALEPGIEVACKAAKARHVTKIRVTDWLFLDPSWIPEDGSDLKIT